MRGQQFERMGGTLFDGHNEGCQLPLRPAHKARVCMRVARLVTKHEAILTAVRGNGGIAKGSLYLLGGNDARHDGVLLCSVASKGLLIWTFSSRVPPLRGLCGWHSVMGYACHACHVRSHFVNLRHGADSLKKAISLFFALRAYQSQHSWFESRSGGSVHRVCGLFRTRFPNPLQSFMFMTKVIGYFHKARFIPTRYK